MSAHEARIFDQWLWDLPQDALDALRLDELHIAAADAQVPFPQVTVTTVIVGDERDPLELLSRGVGVEEYRSAAWGGLLRARLKELRYTVALRRAADGVFHLLGSVPFTDNAWRRVDQSWIPAAHPHVAGVILNRSDFEALGDILVEHGDTRVNRMTARVLRDQSSYSRGWSVMQPSHREALSEARDGMLVHSLSLTAGHTAVHLRRAAGATYYRGDWKAFVGMVLSRLAVAATSRRHLLTGRQRHPEQPVAETLVMHLQPEIAAAPATRERILSAVNSLRGGRTAVLHANPYLHVIATDHLDGSSFDLLITDDHKLTIIPGLLASTGSLARVTDAIGEALGMDELQAEAIPDEIPADEVFGL